MIKVHHKERKIHMKKTIKIYLTKEGHDLVKKGEAPNELKNVVQIGGLKK